jgi:hypothetical protein
MKIFSIFRKKNKEINTEGKPQKFGVLDPNYNPETELLMYYAQGFLQFNNNIVRISSINSLETRQEVQYNDYLEPVSSRTVIYINEVSTLPENENFTDAMLPSYNQAVINAVIGV